jgi:hypothetical protein
MKQILLLLSCFSGFAFGQITLTDQHFAGANESYVFSTLLDMQIDYATTGANYTWNFSTLVPTDQRGLVTKPMSQASALSAFMFGSFAPAPYKATYFNSNVDFPIDQLTSTLPIQIDDMSQFTQKNTSGVYSIGYELVVSGQGIGFRSDTIEKRYVLPMNYNDYSFSRGYTDLDLNPIYDAQWRQHRTRSTTVDGWGTVITPYGTFQALRLHHVITENDSIFLSVQGTGMWIPIPIPVTHEYEWRSTSDKEAVMRIRTNEVLGSEQVTAVEYRDNFNGLGLEELTVELSVFPNPVSDELHIQANQVADALVVIDATGKVVLRQPANSTHEVISVKSLASGSYQLVFLKGASFQAISFIK